MMRSLHVMKIKFISKAQQRLSLERFFNRCVSGNVTHYPRTFPTLEMSFGSQHWQSTRNSPFNDVPVLTTELFIHLNTGHFMRLNTGHFMFVLHLRKIKRSKTVLSAKDQREEI